MDEIKARMQEFVHKYLEVSPEDELTIVDYAIETWKPLGDEVKYLLFVGSNGTGKTRAAHVMAALCHKPLLAKTNMSRTVFLRTLNAMQPCTLIMEEGYFSIFNFGSHKETRHIYRTKIENEDSFSLEVFNIFGHKIFTTRTLPEDNAFLSRCIVVHLHGSTRNDIPRMIGFSSFGERKEIRKLLRKEFCA